MHRKINRKMNKKLLTVMLTIVLLLSTASLIVACGGGDDGDEMAKTELTTIPGNAGNALQGGTASSNPSMVDKPSVSPPLPNERGSTVSDAAATNRPEVAITVTPTPAIPELAKPWQEERPVTATTRPPTGGSSTTETSSPSTPQQVLTVRHHIDGYYPARTCWCGVIHSPSQHDGDDHTDYNCWCTAYGSNYNYATTKHHDVNSQALSDYQINDYVDCWCGATHFEPGFQGHTNGLDCPCWRYDTDSGLGSVDPSIDH